MFGWAPGIRGPARGRGMARVAPGEHADEDESISHVVDGYASCVQTIQFAFFSQALVHFSAS